MSDAILLPCPFCGGQGRLSAKDHLFGGYNGIGESRREYLVKVICNKCHARGMPIATGWVKSTYQQRHSKYISKEDKQAFDVAESKAVAAWNTRAAVVGVDLAAADGGDPA